MSLTAINVINLSCLQDRGLAELDTGGHLLLAKMLVLSHAISQQM